jgi:hypothetical protein
VNTSKVFAVDLGYNTHTADESLGLRAALA